MKEKVADSDREGEQRQRIQIDEESFHGSEMGLCSDIRMNTHSSVYGIEATNRANVLKSLLFDFWLGRKTNRLNSQTPAWSWFADCEGISFNKDELLSPFTTHTWFGSAKRIFDNSYRENMLYARMCVCVGACMLEYVYIITTCSYFFIMLFVHFDVTIFATIPCINSRALWATMEARVYITIATFEVFVCAERKREWATNDIHPWFINETLARTCIKPML